MFHLSIFTLTRANRYRMVPETQDIAPIHVPISKTSAFRLEMALKDLLVQNLPDSAPASDLTTEQINKLIIEYAYKGTDLRYLPSGDSQAN